MPEVNIKLSKKVINEAYLPLFNGINKRFVVLIGSAGSGKSVALTQYFTFLLLKNPNTRLLVARKVGKTIKNSVYEEFQNTFRKWKLGDLVKAHSSTHSFTFANGSEVITTGLDNVEKLKSISNIDVIWLEEGTESTIEDFEQLNLRLRGTSGVMNQFFISTNPNDYDSYIKSMFVDSIHPDAFVLHTTYKDNRFLSQEYIKQLESLIDRDEVFYRIYTLGEWAKSGAIIFSNWQVKNISTRDDNYDSILCGLDFGFNDHTAFIKIGIKDDEIYILDELYKRELTNAELINEIGSTFGKTYLITADSAEPDRIKEFKQAGFKIRETKKGKGSILRGIDWLRTKKIWVHPVCINFINEIKSYSYKVDKNNNPLEEPVDFNNHALDALRYAIEHLTKPTRKATAVPRL